MTRSEVDMSAVRRLLIIKLSALGDIVHALPVSAALGEAFPHVEITWAVEETFAPLIAGNPYVASILCLPAISGRELRSLGFHRRYVRRLRDIRGQRFDLSLDLQGLAKSALVAAATGAPVRLGYHYQREGAGIVTRPIPPQPESFHVVDQYLDVARFLGASADPVRFPFHIPRTARLSVAQMLVESGVPAGRPYISVNPASGIAIKQWRPERFAALLDELNYRLGMPTVLVTANMLVAAEVRRTARRPFADLSGKTDLKQLAAALEGSAVHICGDTGSGHLASALGRPVISLIGPTDPARACPYGQQERAISRRHLCSPGCSPHRCSFGTPLCMDAITVSDVTALAETLAATAVSSDVRVGST